MAAMFEFLVGGIGVEPDPADNGTGHIPNHDSGTRVSFEVKNVGDAGGIANVGVELDDSPIGDFQSSFLNPTEQETGFVGLGRLPVGSHTVLIFVNPGSGVEDHQENTFGVT